MFKIFHKSRKHPIQKDEYGRSLRKRCFERFEEGLRPAQIARELNMIPRTTYRYFESWKKIPKDKDLEVTSTLWRKALKNDTEFSDRLIDQLSENLGMSREEVISRLQQPWGIKTLLKGEWAAKYTRNIQSMQETRLRAALFHVKLLEAQGMSPEQIELEMKSLVSKAGKIDLLPENWSRRSETFVG